MRPLGAELLEHSGAGHRSHSQPLKRVRNVPGVSPGHEVLRLTSEPPDSLPRFRRPHQLPLPFALLSNEARVDDQPSVMSRRPRLAQAVLSSFSPSVTRGIRGLAGPGVATHAMRSTAVSHSPEWGHD